MAVPANLIDKYRSAGLTEAGVKYLNEVRGSPPSRRTGGTKFLSVSCRYPSQKMGCTIQAESRTSELPFVQWLELDEDVVEIYDQPISIRVTRVRAGRNHVSKYTPDFLVLRSTHVEVVEVKPRQAIEKARDSYPAEWVQRQRRWTCLPIAKHFDQLGIQYWVHVTEDIDPIFAANLNILTAAKYLPPCPNESVLLDRLKRAMNVRQATTIQMIVSDLALDDASTVLRWIAIGILFAATSEQLLSDIRIARIFADEAAMQRFVVARSLNGEADPVSIEPQSLDSCKHVDAAEGRAISGVEALTDRQLKLALERYEAALPVIRGERSPSRNERRQLKRMKLAVANGRGALDGFVPLFHKQGNRVSRITEEQEVLMAKVMSKYFAKATRRSARWVYAAIDWGDVPRVSYKTFLAFTRKTPKHEIAKARSGHRSWLAARPQTHPDVRAIWPTMAWELVHIDHTPIDEKVWGQLGVAQILGRPWLTTMIDGWSHAALAFWLSFSPPSWQSLAMLLRDCVRRHGLLPMGWISDQGSEFGGAFWEKFSANYGCAKFDRAVADARCGSQVERTFHMLHRDLIYQLDGNMQNDRDWRSATTSHKSDATARYLLEKIYIEIDHYLFGHHNQKPHGSNTFSPQQKLDQSKSDLGGLLKCVAYDASFRIQTAHRAAREAYRIDSRRGIRVGQRIYWHRDLAQPKHEGKRVEVRIEPFDSSKLYAYLDGYWVECVAPKHIELSSLEEFGRWAQSAIDYYGKPYAAAVKRAADERFAAHQVKIWDEEKYEVRSEMATDAKGDLDHAKEVIAENIRKDEASPMNASSQFDRLRVVEVEPLKEIYP